jgi:branched-chain amino acid transport system substrate-binding protein
LIKKILFTLVFVIFSHCSIYAKSEIVFGASLPINGIMKEWGNSVTSGANSYFKYTNDNNILPQYNITLISYDDKYEPNLTLDNTKKLIFKDKVFALFGFVGTPTVKNILTTIEDTKTPLIAPFTGAMFLRNNHNKNIINIRPNYLQEIEAIIKYLYHNKNITEFSVFYQNDDYGHEGYISLLQILKRYNLELISEGTYKRNTLSINYAYNEIKQSKPKAIIMIGASKANSIFIKKAKLDINFQDTIFATVSFGDANEMIKDLYLDSKNLIFSQVVPSYDDTTIPIVQEYREIYSKYYPKNEFSFISFEAFIGAKIVTQVIKNLDSSINQYNFTKALKEYNDNMQGLNIAYKNNQLLNKVYLFEYSNFSFKEINYDNN